MNKFKKILMLISFSFLAFSFTKEGTNNYLKNIQISNFIEYKNLRIYPLNLKAEQNKENYITLDEAMENNWIKVKESGEGIVNFVKVKNNSDNLILLLTSEIITGAKQDRMIENDVLLPPYSKWIQISVYCVEHGRWNGISEEFKSSKYSAPSKIRQSAKIDESQQVIWSNITERLKAEKIISPTENLKASLEDKKLQNKITAYEEKLANIPALSKSTIGVIVTTSNQIMCLDLFANNRLLNKYWSKLLKSYIMDSINSKKSTVSIGEVKKFFQDINNSEFSSIGTPGLGQLYKIKSNNGKGSLLEYNNSLIHMDFFPSSYEKKDSQNELNLNFRRNQE